MFSGLVNHSVCWKMINTISCLPRKNKECYFPRPAPSQRRPTMRCFHNFYSPIQLLHTAAPSLRFYYFCRGMGLEWHHPIEKGNFLQNFKHLKLIFVLYTIACSVFGSFLVFLHYFGVIKVQKCRNVINKIYSWINKMRCEDAGSIHRKYFPLIIVVCKKLSNFARG